MTLPSGRDWLFSLKTFAAAMLALYIAMWIDLPRPYWAVATVYITSQPLAGATRSKALFRVCGTLLGAAVTVILVPAFVNAPELLTLAIALWVGTCLYFSLLDRTPRGYLLMLAGYTAALIGFPAVNDPGAIFDTAVARTEEITLGIVCASLVSSIVWPQPVTPIVAARLDGWLRETRAWTASVLGCVPGARTLRKSRLQLASDAIELDGLATSLRFDVPTGGRSAGAMPALRQHMLMVLPIVTGIADRLTALESAAALPLAVRSLLNDMALWLATGNTDEARAYALRQRASAFVERCDAHPLWTNLLVAGLAARLRDLIDLRQDTRMLERHIAEGKPIPRDLAFPYTAKARRIRHRDRGMALLSAFGVVSAIVLASGFWIATGWPDGSAAPMMAAVGCSFFASQDDPAPGIIGFANSAILGAVGATVYLFAILPLATNFEMLILAFAPGLLLCGAFMGPARTAPLAMGTAANGLTLLALQNGYSGDFVLFANSAVAVLAGLWTAAITTRLIRSAGREWSVRRLHRINRDSLSEAAGRRGPGDGLELAAIMLDRVGLIAPRLASMPDEEHLETGDLLSEIRAGVNVVELRRVRTNLSGTARTRITGLLAALALHFKSHDRTPPAALLAAIGECLDAVLEESETAARRDALLGLAGLRRALFPGAQFYEVPPPVNQITEVAA